MRHIQTFKVFESAQELSPEQVEFLDEYTDGTWSVNPSTGLVDVEGDFRCPGRNLKDFRGVRFGRVTWSFDCSNNHLESLEGAPQTVGGYFDCSGNPLQSLEGAPQTVGGDFNCLQNSLWSLEGAPRTVGGGFYCSHNSLTTLEGAPETVEGGFYYNVEKLDGVNIPEGGWTIPDLVKKYYNSRKKNRLLGTHRLLGTLVSPEALQRRIDQNPEKMAVELKDGLKGILATPGYQNLKFPQGLQTEVDLLSDLSGVGL